MTLDGGFARDLKANVSTTAGPLDSRDRLRRGTPAIQTRRRIRRCGSERSNCRGNRDSDCFNWQRHEECSDDNSVAIIRSAPLLASFARNGIQDCSPTELTFFAFRRGSRLLETCDRRDVPLLSSQGGRRGEHRPRLRRRRGSCLEPHSAVD
jgi:hypothetical protein